ncbi:hypothetical protein L2W95_18100 [Citrobacter freundii]|uniref:hypothetical protein n=1 Tax=Citrobacter freundii TaxID=546 RepID=UPI00237A6055|nr:hypothetical protein [Citrobacter freundii]MDE9635418.1 hypothetical protein [Citrobacter freundii]MDQ9162861.1 hypothetical protein [Citrobacter freundii]HCA7170505.1 hypothetical protein [Citrobacter freundii]HCA7951701.1 hypothetical protein [Citrobacter freundii]HCD8985317.1 hypothetical protein [Citrobacter freundii]
MTANKPMTGAQLDELMAVAMRMQSDSEKMGERSVSIFAYAVQVAVLEIRETRCKYEELQSQNTNMAVQLANAESKCRELAAENVALNDKMNKLATWPGIEFYSSAWEFCNLDGNDALEFMCDVQTPATNDFLAEVRASAIPADVMAAIQKVARIRIDLNDFDGDKRGIIDCLSEAEESLIEVVNKFAAQLRKGVQS